MGLEINNLLELWKTQNISIDIINQDYIDEVQISKHLKLPQDFIDFYKIVNGMKSLYPDEIDDEGFLFYPVENIIALNLEFERDDLGLNETTFIFAEYMHKSWWYGFRLIDSNIYEIGIITDYDRFKKITNSLAEFIVLYVENSPLLYEF